MVVLARPLAFDLNTTLWCSFAVTEVSARQRRVSLFVEYGHADGSFFEGWSMCGAVGEAAGQFVDRLLNGVQRHVELLARDTFGDEHLYADFAVRRGELSEAACGHSTFGC